MTMAESSKTNVKDDKQVKHQQQQQQQQQQQKQQQQQQQQQQCMKNKKKKILFRKRHLEKPFDLGVLDLLTAIVFCYLTYFVLCIFQKFVNFLSNECYFITFLILLLGIVVLQIKQHFRSSI
jgi:FtsH-binding integral membrane protein